MKKSFIPTINISSIINKKFGSKKLLIALNNINKALINVGFFQITGHGINKKILIMWLKLQIIFLIHQIKIK